MNPFIPMNMNGMGMAPLNQMMMINNMGNNNLNMNFGLNMHDNN